MHRTPLIVLGSATLILSALTPVAANADPITISGTVTAGGAGIGGVEVDFADAQTSTNADGSFSLPIDSGSASSGWILIGGTAPIVTGAGGNTYASAVVGAAGAQAAQAGLVAPLSTGDLASLPPVSVSLQSTGGISGADRSLANAGVTVSPLEGNSIAGETQADGSGAYTITNLPSGRYTVHVDANRYTQSVDGDVTVQPGQTTTYSPKVPATGTLKGRVTVAKKAPGAAVPVNVFAATRHSDSRGSTAKTGSYSLNGLVAGTYTARYGTYGTRSTQASGKWIPKTVKTTVASGGTTTTNVDLAIGGTLSLTIKKPTGAKSVLVSVIKGSTTYAQRNLGFGKKTSVTTSASGLPNGKYTVSVATDKKMAVKTLTVKVKKTTKATLSTFPKTALTLKGVATGATGGQVSLSTKDGANTAYFSAKIGPSGSFSFSGLVPNDYVAYVSPSNGAYSGPFSVHLRASTTQNLRTSGAYGNVKGSFTLNGLPFGGADVTLTSPPGQGGSIAVADDGTFTAQDGLAAGTYRFTAVSSTGSSAIPVGGPYWLAPTTSGTFTVKAGQTTDLGTVALQVHGG